MENKNDKTQLLGMTPEELGAFFKEQGQPAFRAKQVFAWLHQGVPFEKMSNLPKVLRETLEETCIDNPVSVIETIQSRLDGTIKLLYRLPDDHVIEGVLMRYKYGNTLCLSTQVGCRMGCKFCASTLDGCARSLTPAEMLGQIVCANGILAGQGEGQKVGNIVLMGSGEPFDNYDNVVKFLRILRMEGGLCIGMRSVSLSTCGLVENMRRFAQEDLPVTLSLSLHAPNDEIRRKTMPIANRYSMDEILSACRYYIEKTGRRVIFEYALVHGVNAAPEHAAELASRLRGMQCHVNLIPLNAVPERGLQGVSEREVDAFRKVLEQRNISVTRRREMGDDIEGACGQLRRRYLKDQRPNEKE
ncbi:MAG: 23S rRNA (adenine(2503)-C(2))-methyltransferase RlmN [Clostridiales bacterium]|nr:23S rRNA (adenine(2503)-C(2))-methyltransferase RlmN [Clostridiales bacterium]MDY3764309.1 23S rRNA (adenine(2503)-C(2))-methyltransferase RlmN [Candidatus Ventricola sp.]